MSPPVEMPEKFDHLPFEDGIASAKVNVKKPKKGISNWFDALDTDESSLSNHYEHETLNPKPHDQEGPRSQDSVRPMITHKTIEQETLRPAPAITSRKSSLSTKNRRTGQAERKLCFKLDSSPQNFQHASELEQLKMLTRTSMIRSAPGSPTGRNSRILSSPRGLSMRDVDLQIQSVLNLSSSEDEDDTESEVKTHEPAYQPHRIRASMERREYSDEAFVGNALRVQAVKPKPVVNRQSDRSPYRRSHTTSAIPPVPQLPSRPQLTQRTSSMHWQSLLEDKPSGLPSQPQHASTTTTTTTDASESTVDSAGESSMNGNTPPSSQSPPGTRLGSNNRSNINTPLRRGSKLMSVTSEEETLLEAMREKRASIRAKDFQKGFNSAMQLHVVDYITRPKTSGADGRTSRSSIYGAGSSRGSISPPLLGPPVYRPRGRHHHHQQQQQHQGAEPHIQHLYKASLGANSGLSASTDNLTLEDAYPFPEVPSEPIPPSVTRSPALRSENPSLTFSSSDILPGSSSIMSSPLTPPPSEMSMGSLMGAYGVLKTSCGISPDPSAQLEVNSGGGGGGGGRGYGHERRETGSSSVVVLDGVESYAAKLDEENEISGWALDSGMDKW